MALFSEKINGQYAALLSVHTDNPPARICLALFEKLEDLWSIEYWGRWYNDLEDHVLLSAGTTRPRGSRRTAG